MSAREMFEELGYESEKTHVAWLKIYRKTTHHIDSKIVFNMIEKTMFFHNVNTVLLVDVKFNCDMPTFKAIHQQLKELGWIGSEEE